MRSFLLIESEVPNIELNLLYQTINLDISINVDYRSCFLINNAAQDVGFIFNGYCFDKTVWNSERKIIHHEPVHVG